ncbi:TonB-dependent receptor domain-containing protein [Sphingobium ummariense]
MARMRWTLISAVSLTSAVPAFAQEVPATPQSTPTEAGASDKDQAGTPSTLNAQSAPTGDGEIVVTGSRLRIGFESPTPVTVASSDQLRAAAPTTLSDGLNQLPQFKNSSRAQNASVSATRDNGASFLNLRGLGAQRTLVLLDGRRVVSSSISGSPDVNLFPQALVKRVEIVTGGASAAYGSDAVAGVVNFIIDRDFTGVLATTQAGISDFGDGGFRQASLSVGAKFAGGRGRVLGSFEYYDQDTIPPPGGRDWASSSYQIIVNPSGSPARLIAPNVRLSNASFGGLILNGPLANMQFLPGGVLAPFTKGQYETASTMVGGDGAFVKQALAAGIRRRTAFLRAEYETGGVTLFAEGNFGHVVTNYQQMPNPNYAANYFTIFGDNAFLPADVKAALGSATSFRLSRLNEDWGMVNANNRSNTYRGTIGLNWESGGGWAVSAYYMHGENNYRVLTKNNMIWRRTFAAADAVVDPATGSIVCRSTLQGLDPGCVPLNLFGEGSASPAALAYILGTAQSELRTKQDVASLSIAGKPFKTWAGDVNVALGVEYRSEWARQTSDAISQQIRDGSGLRYFPAGQNGGLGGFYATNPQPLFGKYNVKEAFLEVEVPLATDVSLAKSLMLNAAVRAIDYSTSGYVTTWKVGGHYEPFADLRFRVTRSRDIRAPNIDELFRSPTDQIGSVFYNNLFERFVSTREGNPDLQPEIANTLTGGVVYRPSWVKGFNISLDYFDIKIDEGISQPSAQQIVDTCAAGAQVTCALISRNAQGTLVIDNPTINLAAVETRGFDLEGSYQFTIGADRVNLRLLGSYLDKFSTTTPGSPPVDRAGDIGTTGTPKLSATASVTYSASAFELFLQERYIGSGKIDTTAVANFFADNHVDPVWYTDASVRFNVGDKSRIQFFVTVNNLFNRLPPIVPTIPYGTYRATNFSLYDVVGRYFTGGARVKF